MYSIAMDAPSQQELVAPQAAGYLPGADMVVHWQSDFGLIVIETLGSQVFVNGELVESAAGSRRGEGTTEARP